MTTLDITIVETNNMFTFSGVMSVSDGNLVQSVQQIVDGSPNSIELLLSTTDANDSYNTFTDPQDSSFVYNVYTDPVAHVTFDKVYPHNCIKLDTVDKL